MPGALDRLTRPGGDSAPPPAAAPPVAPQPAAAAADLGDDQDRGGAAFGRLYVSWPLVDRVDEAHRRIRRRRRSVRKMRLVDELLAYGLEHLDEVEARLRGQ